MNRFCSGVTIVRNEGTIVFGNIFELSPQSNSTTIANSGAGNEGEVMLENGRSGNNGGNGACGGKGSKGSKRKRCNQRTKCKKRNSSNKRTKKNNRIKKNERNKRC
jgi:hypothetical protein